MLRKPRLDESEAGRAGGPGRHGEGLRVPVRLGGTLVLLTLALPSASDRFIPGMIAPPIAAYGVVALMLLRGGQLPRGFFPWLPMWGAVLVTGVCTVGGRRPRSTPTRCSTSGWSSPRSTSSAGGEAAPNLALVAVGYAVVLLSHDRRRRPPHLLGHGHLDRARDRSACSPSCATGSGGSWSRCARAITSRRRSSARCRTTCATRSRRSWPPARRARRRGRTTPNAGASSRR